MENEINYPAPIAPITPHQPYKAIGQEQDQGQFGNFGVQDPSAQNQDMNPNEWSDTHNSQQVQSLSLEQQQAMQNQIMARTDAQVRRNEGLAQQQINDRLFASIETDSNAKAQELNSKINEIDNPKNLSEADLIANRGALLGQAQNAPDKYEKNYYTRHRNTGIGYIDKKEELSIVDAYYIKKYIPNIDLSYKFLKHDITADVTMKNKGQAQAIANLQQIDNVSTSFVENNAYVILSKLNNGNLKISAKQMFANMFGKTLGTFGTQEVETTSKQLNDQLASITTMAQDAGNRITDYTRKKWDDYRPHKDVDSDIGIFKRQLNETQKILGSRLRRSELSHLQNGELAGYQAMYKAGQELLSFINQPNAIQNNPEKFVELVAKYQGKSVNDAKTTLPQVKNKY